MNVLKEGIVSKDFQTVGTKYLLDNKYTILADEMGLGKSFQAIHAALVMGHQTLCVVPGNLRINWVREIQKFTGDKVKIGLIKDKKDIDKITMREDFFVASYEMIQKMPYLMELCPYWILDEAQFIKTPGALRTKYIFDSLYGVSRPEYISLLTGTPITNRVTDFYNLLAITSMNPELKGINVKKKFDNWFKFANYFSHRKEKIVHVQTKGRKTYKHFGNGKKVTTWEGFREERLGELQELMVGKYIRRLGKDHLDLDPLQRKDIVLKDSINRELEKVYSDLKKGVQSAHMMEVKEKNAYYKTKFTCAYAIQLFDEIEEPILIFTAHVGASIKMRQDLKYRGYRTAVIHGNLSDKNRQESVDKFTTGELDFLVATIGTSSTGYTFTNCRNIIFNDYSFVPADNEQAEKRIHRIGQTKVCKIHRIIGDATDERILKLIEEKKKVIDLII